MKDAGEGYQVPLRRHSFWKWPYKSDDLVAALADQVVLFPAGSHRLVGNAFARKQWSVYQACLLEAFQGTVARAKQLWMLFLALSSLRGSLQCISCVLKLILTYNSVS